MLATLVRHAKPPHVMALWQQTIKSAPIETAHAHHTILVPVIQ